MSEVSAHKKNLWKAWGKRLLTLFFFTLVCGMLFMLVKNLDWQDVKLALQSFSVGTLLLCLMITTLSYLLFSSYDLLGRVYTGHQLPAKQIMPVAFTCYAFNLNISAWVGSIAMRYRLYSRLGLDLATITRVLSFSLATNWLGYMLISGIVFSLRIVKLPENWTMGAAGLQLVGIALLGASITYLLACSFAKQRTWTFGKHEIPLPTLTLALLQVGMAALNWSLSSLVIFLLLPDTVTYAAVLGIILLSSIAGVVTHIPAGIGVLEAISIALLQHEITKGTILAALIGYRAIYLLLPLMLASVTYLILERRAKTLRRSAHIN
jgi:glycosyltransferase 2 family protein